MSKRLFSYFRYLMHHLKYTLYLFWKWYAQ